MDLVVDTDATMLQRLNRIQFYIFSEFWPYFLAIRLGKYLDLGNL